MKNPQPLIQIRSRKLGVLMYDSRIHSRRSIEECAAAVGVTPKEYRAFERGSTSPSLPQIELLSVYLNISLEHFWGKTSLTDSTKPMAVEENERILALRNRVIGASLRLARDAKNLDLADLSAQSGIPAENLQRYEIGAASLPLPELEVLLEILETPLGNFYDQHGPIGKWRAQQGTSQVIQELPPELQAFVSKAVNRPYLEIALKLSEMPVDKLRILAESLLEITY
jgi:transcriptional regulator with XRE-family HTH domain